MILAIAETPTQGNAIMRCAAWARNVGARGEGQVWRKLRLSREIFSRRTPLALNGV